MFGSTLMDKRVAWILAVTAVLAMGISMPSCPGQQAMQQQIDQIAAKQTELIKNISNLDKQVKAFDADMKTVKEVMPQMGKNLADMHGKINEIVSEINMIETKIAPKSGKAGGKKKGK